MIIAGIDYSMTSPAICVHDGDEWDAANCSFYFLASKPKQVMNDGKLCGVDYPHWTIDQQRYENLANWATDILTNKHKVDDVFLEGYAFGATGRVFHIAENTGMLKYAIWKKCLPYHVLTPGTIKKAATGKGNADKARMYEAFVADTGIDLRQRLDIKSEKQWNPISDIADAYWICKLGFTTLQQSD